MLDTLYTERLRLRRWTQADREPFAALNADPVVMEHFPAALDRARSDAFVDTIEALWDAQGWGLWAVEVLDGPACIGYVGLMVPTFQAPFTPCVEIGWRLAKEHWGQGFAPEAARAVLKAAFEQIGLDRVVSFTSTTNVASQRVMQKIGLVHEPSLDFDHPSLPPGNILERHVLYRMTAAEWQAAQALEL